MNLENIILKFRKADNINFILAQTFAFFSSLCLLFSFWQKNRKQILFFRILDSSFDILQYFLLGAYAGSLISLLGMARAFTFTKTNNRLFLALFLLLYMLASIMTFNGLISIIPLIAFLVYTIVTWNKKERNIRLFSIIVFLLWFIYDILVKAYVSFITDIILIISNIIAFYNLDIKSSVVK